MSDLTPVTPTTPVPPTSAAQSSPDAPAASQRMIWPYVIGLVVVAVGAVLGPQLAVLVLVPGAPVIALFFPRTHRLPGTLRAMIYLLAGAAVAWLAIIGFFAYELSRPGAHIG